MLKVSREKSPVASRRWHWVWLLPTTAWLMWTGLAAACLYEARSPRLLCLLYHRFATAGDYSRIAEAGEQVYTISDIKFDEQMSALKRLGYRSISLDEAVAFVDGRGAIPDRAVLLTIDDGSRNALKLAGPILKRHGFGATLFVTTDPAAYVFTSTVPDSARLSDDDIRRLDRSVWRVGGHGHTHRPLRDMSDVAMGEELRANREALAGLTGAAPVAMAVPGNWSGPNVRRVAPGVGYTHVFVSDAGFIQAGDDPTALPRVNVSGRWSLRGFESGVSDGTVVRRRLGRTIRWALSFVIGERAATIAAKWIRATLPPELSGFLIGQAALLVITATCVWRSRRAHINNTPRLACQADPRG